MKYKMVFFGTNDFADNALRDLLKFEEIEIIHIISQPDRKIGRKQQVTFTSTKKTAREFNIPISQPEKIKDFYSELAEMEIDLIITCAYGQFLPTKILKLARIKAINIHASLLPKLRGGAPIHWAIINREKVTGITLMEMQSIMDAGDIYTQNEIKIDDKDTYQTLKIKLFDVTKKSLEQNLIKIIKGDIVAKPQDPSKVTFGLNILRNQERNGKIINDEIINWNKSAQAIEAQIRGLYDSPIAYTTINNFIFKIHKAEIITAWKNHDVGEFFPGEIVEIDKSGILVATAKEWILIKSIQAQGKTAVPASNYFGTSGQKLDRGVQFETVNL